MEDQKEIDQKPKEIIAEGFMQGCFSGEHYTRAKYKCSACHRRHVALESGPGRDFPTSISVICETCGTKLIIRGWQPEK
jgi:DNA-directed RNA polymerase subunit RPC12/RpoP